MWKVLTHWLLQLRIPDIHDPTVKTTLYRDRNLYLTRDHTFALMARIPISSLNLSLTENAVMSLLFTPGHQCQCDLSYLPPVTSLLSQSLSLSLSVWFKQLLQFWIEKELLSPYCSLDWWWWLFRSSLPENDFISLVWESKSKNLIWIIEFLLQLQIFNE